MYAGVMTETPYNCSMTDTPQHHGSSLPAEKPRDAPYQLKT